MLQRCAGPFGLKQIVFLWVIGGLICSTANGNSQEGRYSIPVTKDLNMEQVAIEIESADNSKEALRKQMVEKFAQAGIFIAPIPQPSEAKSVILRFTQDQTSLEPVCPHKVFYLARLELIEPVRIKRNDKLVVLGHWDSVQSDEVRGPVSLTELSKSLDDQIQGFLSNYKLANQFHPAQEKHRRASDEVGKGNRLPLDGKKLGSGNTKATKNSNLRQPEERSIKNVLNWEQWSSLDRLDLDQMFWGQGDDSYAEYRAARERLLSAGMKLHTKPGETSTPDSASKLIFTLESIPLGDECSGYVVYKLGLVLREHVRIERNGIERWADTWGSYLIQVRPLFGMNVMEEDQLRLIDRFIHDYKVTHPTMPGQ